MDLETALNYFAKPGFSFPEEELKCLLESPEKVTPLFVQDWKDILAMSHEDLLKYDSLRYLHGIEFLLYWGNQEIRGILRELITTRDPDWFEELLGADWQSKLTHYIVRTRDPVFLSVCSGIVTDNQQSPELQDIAFQIMGSLTLLDVVSIEEFVKLVDFYLSGGIQIGDSSYGWYSLAGAILTACIPEMNIYLKVIDERAHFSDTEYQSLEEYRTIMNRMSRNKAREILIERDMLDADPVATIRSWPAFNSEEHMNAVQAAMAGQIQNSASPKPARQKSKKKASKKSGKASKYKRWV